jgi:hypothetical protein
MKGTRRLKRSSIHDDPQAQQSRDHQWKAAQRVTLKRSASAGESIVKAVLQTRKMMKTLSQGMLGKHSLSSGFPDFRRDT